MQIYGAGLAITDIMSSAKRVILSWHTTSAAPAPSEIKVVRRIVSVND